MINSGCAETGIAWKRITTDVGQTRQGVHDCRNACVNEGPTYKYWGFECPHATNEVHCNCATSVDGANWLETSKCFTHNMNSASHCNKKAASSSAPDAFSISSVDGIYHMGSGSMSSVYAIAVQREFF